MALDDARAAAHEDVQRVGRLPLLSQNAAEGERRRDEAPDDLRAGLVREEPEDGELVEDAGVRHGSSTGQLACVGPFDVAPG